MTKIQREELVAMLLGGWPQARVNEHTPMVYGMALADLEFEHAAAAVRRLLLTAKFIPTVAEIREAAVEILHGDRRAGAEAWGDVLRAVSKFGIHRDPSFEDPLVAEAVAAVGWRAICNSEETDSAPRAKFADAYNSLAKTGRKDAALSTGATTPQLEARSNRSVPMAELVKQIADKESDDV